MLLNVTQINEDYIPTVAFYLPIPFPSTHIMDLNLDLCVHIHHLWSMSLPTNKVPKLSLACCCS